MRKVRCWLLVAVLCVLATALQAAPITIAGQVLGPDGKPVMGAQVITLVSVMANSFQPSEALTDADGRFSLQTEPLRYGMDLPVLACKTGLAMAFGQGKPGAQLTLKLGDKPEARSGVLLSPEGKPAANVSVTANSVSLAGEAGSPGGMALPLPPVDVGLRVTTDDAGRFSFDGFAPGLTLTVNVAMDGYAGTVVSIPTSVPVTATLQPEATISGKVLVAGQPQAGIAVWSSGRSSAGVPPSSTKTAADGTYTLRHLGAGTVIVSTNTVAGMASAENKQVQVQTGQAITDVDFILTPGAIIRGTVTDAKTGQPVAKAYVHAITAPLGRPNAKQTDAAGKYELRVRPGKYRVQCTQLAGGPMMMPTAQYSGLDELIVKEGDVIEGWDLAIKLPRTVQVQVLRPDGQPATGASVINFGGLLSGLNFDLQPEGRFEATVPEPVAPGEPGHYLYEPMLLVTELEHNLAAYVNLQTAPETLKINLQPAATVTALVTDMQNQPLKGFGLSVGYPQGEHGWGSQGIVLSDERGTIRLTCLPAGVGLRFFATGDMMRLVANDSLSGAALTLAPGEERRLPPIVVNPAGRSLNVFVGEANGMPVKGAQVYAADARTPAVTDEQGKVTLTKLPLKGKVMLLAIHPTQDWYAAESIDPDAGVWPGLIVKPLGKATGVLIAKTGGKPLEGVQVRCHAAGEFWQLDYEVQRRVGLIGQTQQSSTTDAEGRWHLDNLLPGMGYNVVVWQKAQPNMGSDGGFFKAEGGTDEQDTGVVECTLAPPAPPPAPGAPAGGAPMPPPPPPPPAR